MHFINNLKYIRVDNGLISLKENDQITFDRANSKYITFGKNYRVIKAFKSHESNETNWFYFIDDSGKKETT